MQVNAAKTTRSYNMRLFKSTSEMARGTIYHLSQRLDALKDAKHSDLHTDLALFHVVI